MQQCEFDLVNNLLKHFELVRFQWDQCVCCTSVIQCEFGAAIIFSRQSIEEDFEAVKIN